MRLRPVHELDNPGLRDADAKRPADLAPKKELAAETEKLLDRLAALQRVFAADGRFAMLVVLQGRDASGKDGTIRRVFSAFNPQGCTVTSFKQPTPIEAAHDFLWRIHLAVPPRGTIGIFNRSHYEDVLIARVRELVPRERWERRFEAINAFERHLAEEGVVIRKFFLHVSAAEQRSRLLERIEDPDKNWKFDAGDLDDRDRWAEYDAAYRDALTRCSTPHAPWYVVPADSKSARDHLVAQVLVDALESLDLRYPTPQPELARYVERFKGSDPRAG